MKVYPTHEADWQSVCYFIDDDGILTEKLCNICRIKIFYVMCGNMSSIFEKDKRKSRVIV